MTPVLEAFLIATLAGMVAGVSVGWMNRNILKFKKRRAQWSKWSRGRSSDLDVNVDVS